MTKEEMLAIINGPQPPAAPQPVDDQADVMGSPGGAFPFSLPSLDSLPTRSNGTAPTYQTYDHPTIGPSVSVASDMPGGGSHLLSEEQLRHSLAAIAQASNLTPNPGTAMAPPLNAAGQAVDPQAYQLGLTPHEGSYARQLALGETTGGAAMEALQGMNMLGNQKNRQRGLELEADAGRRQIDIEASKNKEQYGIDQQAAEMAKDQEARAKAVAERGQIAANQQMQRVHAAADDAAQARIHNFWEGKDTGARILGVLAQAFAGAANGLAGNPSAPTPLDRIIARDLEMQQLNLQQKNRNVENQRGMLRDIFEQTGSAQQANAAFVIASWKRIEAQGNALKNKFASPAADAAYDKLQGITAQRIADASDKTAAELVQLNIQKQQHGMNILAETERTDATTQAAAAQAQAANQHDRFHIAGTKGEMGQQAYTQVKDAHEGYTAVMAQASRIRQIASDYKAGKLSEAQAIQDYNVARGDLVAAQRKVQNTGAAMSDQEFNNLQTQLPDLTKNFIFPESFSAGIGDQIQRIMDTSSRRYFSLIDRTVQGVSLDEQDPIYGEQVKRYHSELASQNLARSNG